MKHTICLACAVVLTAGLALPAQAAHIDGSELCFGPAALADEPSPLTGICITQLPESCQGAVMLGQRQLRPGDVLTAQQMTEIVFVAAQDTQEDFAIMRYLPVFADGLSDEATMTLSVRGKENKAPIAEDSAFETYKNLEVTGKLRVRDPEGQAMQFTVIRQPKRGTITIGEDGSFTYTPKKNKVGIDSFTYTAADAAGKVSRETTVTVTILKPSDAKQYSDTSGKSCRFAAEWMKNTGIFVGESLDGNPCFSPDRTVTQGEFLTMLVKTLNLPTDPNVTEIGYADAPAWLKPYLAAAIRSGLLSAVPEHFEDAITAEDAAGLLCCALSLTPKEQVVLSSMESQPAFDSLAVAQDYGFPLEAGQELTRGETAQLLYQVSRFSQDGCLSNE